MLYRLGGQHGGMVSATHDGKGCSIAPDLARRPCLANAVLGGEDAGQKMDWEIGLVQCFSIGGTHTTGGT